jgi:hypothetical protein
VVKSNLTLGNYGGGINVKFILLRKERRGFTTSKTILVNDKKLQVFPVELVLKNLTPTSA